MILYLIASGSNNMAWFKFDPFDLSIFWDILNNAFLLNFSSTRGVLIFSVNWSWFFSYILMFFADNIFHYQSIIKQPKSNTAFIISEHLSLNTRATDALKFLAEINVEYLHPFYYVLRNVMLNDMYAYINLNSYKAEYWFRICRFMGHSYLQASYFIVQVCVYNYDHNCEIF